LGSAQWIIAIDTSPISKETFRCVANFVSWPTEIDAPAFGLPVGPKALSKGFYRGLEGVHRVDDPLGILMAQQEWGCHIPAQASQVSRVN
jgi:hypothetical protein